MTKELKAIRLLQIESLFRSKSWKILDDSEDIFTLFNRYCERLSILNEKQQDLVVDLSHDFLKIGINDYYTLFLKSFNKINIGLLQSSKHIYLLPLSMTNKTNSSHFIWYWLNNACDFSKIKYFNKISFINTLSSVNFKLLDKSLYIFIDDFIGTGETVETNILKNLQIRYNGYKFPRDRIVILSLIGQKEGIDKTKLSFNIPVFSGIDRMKGISDKYTGDTLRENINEMKRLESSLDIPKKYHFGYGKSEGLLTILEKTPNNTFPVFWFETKTKIAPFPRYKIYEKVS